MERILTVAASDSSGGAGIQADLKTITLMGSFAMSVVTALTAQNTKGITEVRKVPASFIGRQLDAVLSDIGADAVKTGALVDSGVITMVARKIKDYKCRTVVVDPVMVSTSGTSLLARSSYSSFKKAIIPLASIITPNLYEAALLTGQKVEKRVQMKEAAQKLHQLGARNALVTGGHLKGRPIDILYDGKDFYEFDAERVTTRSAHGTGCTFSAALTTLLTQGTPLLEAVVKAKAFVSTAIRTALDLGKGADLLNSYSAFMCHQGVSHCSDELRKALAMLTEGSIGHLIPEVQSNLGYALPHASRFDEVIAFPGRIVKLNKSIATVASPMPGASRHIAQIILTVMRYQSDLRSAMNIKYSPEIIKKCRTLGLRLSSFDRADEPSSIKIREGASLSWGIDALLKNKKSVPDIIFDLGDNGKEPMVRVIGKDPLEVAHKVLQIAH
jgi:hydroxymethylpyrimidine/phosphomethylpyrimidine kinase